LAWAYYPKGDLPAARASARQAQQLNAEMGYQWGQVDAAVAAAVAGG
jgi:hypothetical protein